MNLSLGHVYRAHRQLPTFNWLNRFVVLSYGIPFSRNEATGRPANVENPLSSRPRLTETSECGLISPWQKGSDLSSTHDGGKQNTEGGGTSQQPCTTTLKCLQPSLHEGCQKLHSNTDRDGKSLLSFRIPYEMAKWHSRNPRHSAGYGFFLRFSHCGFCKMTRSFKSTAKIPVVAKINAQLQQHPYRCFLFCLSSLHSWWQQVTKWEANFCRIGNAFSNWH